MRQQIYFALLISAYNKPKQAAWRKLCAIEIDTPVDTVLELPRSGWAW